MLHLQLQQNIGYIPHVAQYILLAYLIPNSLYLLLPHCYIAPNPVITSMSSISVSASFGCIHWFVVDFRFHI